MRSFKVRFYAFRSRRILTTYYTSTEPLEMNYIIKTGEKMEKIPMKVYDQAHFDSLVASGSRMQSHDGTGRPIQAVTRWEEATAAVAAGNHLTVTDLTILLEDTTKLKSANANRAAGMETQITHAIARDPKLREQYGELQVVNDGYAVVFRFEGCDVLEVDGLIKSCDTLFLNEAKVSIDKRDVDKMAPADSSSLETSNGSWDEDSVQAMTNRVDALQRILKNPQVFQSDPPGVMSELAPYVDKPIVLIASGFHVPRRARERCREKQILLLSPRAQGGNYEISFP